MEHLTNLHQWKKESFIIEHWMQRHGLSPTPPEFTFKVIGAHKGPLSRQLEEAIFIRTEGNLNKRNEFTTNELIRMEAHKYSWEVEKEYKARWRENKLHNECLENIIAVMKRVNN